MERRNFLKTAGFTSLARSGRFPGKEKASSRFPFGSRPKQIFAVPVDSLEYHTRILLTCLQGLVNRRETRIYLNASAREQFWLDYYQKELSCQVETVPHWQSLFTLFSSELKEYILYDPSWPHSLNLATMIGAIHNLLPVSRTLEDQVKSFLAPSPIDAIRPARDTYSAYQWALKEWRPKCHPDLMAQLCVHHPHWPTSTFTNRDYVIAHKIFCFDLSCSERDRIDYQRVGEIYKAFSPGTIVMGWHCIRDTEHEAIALSSRFGHFGLCSLNTPNLTVHSSIRLPEGKTFHPPQKPGKSLQDKTYIAFMDTDGDATWFMLDLALKDWRHPLHGKIRYNWGFLPLTYDLMPAIAKYYLENQLENDYFVAGPSGATYTYPHLHPDPAKFLQLSGEYLRKCGLTTVHITNWNDRDWWQEVDLPHFLSLLCRHLPDCVGYMRGMGESAFEPNYIDGCKPFIFCGEGIHVGSDVYQTMKDFMDANPNRPLFLFCLVNHTVPQDQIQSAVERFPEGQVELVHADELLQLIRQAYLQGKIGSELYPAQDGNRKLLQKEARKAWPQCYKEIQELARQIRQGETSYRQAIQNTPLGLERIALGDFLAFQCIGKCMELIKLTLETHGIYVNHKPTARKRFVAEFSRLKEMQTAVELDKLWQNWHQSTFSFLDAVRQAQSFIRLAEEINQLLLGSPR